MMYALCERNCELIGLLEADVLYLDHDYDRISHAQSCFQGSLVNNTRNPLRERDIGGVSGRGEQWALS